MRDVEGLVELFLSAASPSLGCTWSSHDAATLVGHSFWLRLVRILWLRLLKARAAWLMELLLLSCCRWLLHHGMRLLLGNWTLTRHRSCRLSRLLIRRHIIVAWHRLWGSRGSSRSVAQTTVLCSWTHVHRLVFVWQAWALAKLSWHGRGHRLLKVLVGQDGWAW